METLLIAVLAGVGFIIAYQTYGQWLGRKIFRLSRERICPSEQLKDGVDFVPTDKSIVFGHHFTSIAGTGPIVGPAIAVMWGWLPALLWVVFGSIFIGAVHDLGSLVVSLRNRGQTIGDVAGKLLGNRVRILFLIILFMALTVVLAIFGLVISAVFRMYPSAIFPCVIQIPFAIWIGLVIYKKGGGIFLPSAIVLALMYLSVVFGDVGILHQFNTSLAGWPVLTWVLVLLIYCYIASILPVWMLLQSRDYINSLQLITAMGLILVGLIVAALMGGTPVEGDLRPSLSMTGPMIQWNPLAAPDIFPMLFVTVACGAISGFHCLVSSGTSSKQLRRETDATMVGYGSMLTEGFLAVLVILACSAGIGLGVKGPNGILTGHEAWDFRYESWKVSEGLGSTVGSFVGGAGNFLMALGISNGIATALMGVLVASFAATTLDTACRLQRYVIQELGGIFAGGGEKKTSNPLINIMRNDHGATLLAVVLAVALAAVPKSGETWAWNTAGKGGLILWPLFGATNQLLGGLAFMVITVYLWRRNRPIWFLVFPSVFMLIMPIWAMVWSLFIGNANVPSWWSNQQWLLVSIGLATIALELWMIAEAILLFPKIKGVIEAGAEPGELESAA